MFKFTPLYEFRGTTMWKAWVINSIILGLITAFTVEIRRIMDEHQFISMLPDIPHKFIATILISSNEGWGLALTESLMTGTPIIATVTGGMQDQMRFVDENGKWFTPSADVPSNHRGTYKKHGEWAFPVYPTSRSIQGSPPTPYIYDDRCCFEDVAERIGEIYNMDPKERKSRGLKGREWAISDEAGFTSEHQGNRVMEAFNELFDTWKPREKYEIINATTHKPSFLNHKIIY